ncbi:MAG: alpha-2-macroglobulin, partial [Anaerolineae bacterium]|nr:alpha-2-macroglobulin [Anaerolineae bacterium]
ALAEAGATGRASEYTGDLYDNRDKLSHYGCALLALTLDLVERGDSRIGVLLSDLNNAAILSATGAHWEEQVHDWWAMNTDTRSTGIVLDALTRLDPDNDLIPNVVRWLMVARKGGIWETTQETAWALIAFTDWMVVTGELGGNYEYAVALNGEELAAGRVDADNVDESIRLRVAIADLLRDQGNVLNVGRGEGEGRLYYTAHLRVYLPVEEIEAVNRGIAVYRQYTDAACVPQEGAPCPELQEVAVGDTVRVVLTIVAPSDLYYVVVEDPLPAGGEAIDTGLATTSLLEQDPRLQRQAQNPMWRDYYWWWWHWYSRTEMRDEKVVLFADYLPKGTYEYTYTFRATLPGEYRVIPTVASEMYFPEVFGRSDGRLLTIAAGE